MAPLALLTAVVLLAARPWQTLAFAVPRQTTPGARRVATSPLYAASSDPAGSELLTGLDGQGLYTPAVTHTGARARTHGHTHTHAHARAHAHTHACTRARVRAHTHTRARARTHAHLCQGRLQLLVAKGFLLGEHRQGRQRAGGAVHRAVAARGGHARHVEAHAHAGLRAEGDHARGVARAVAGAAVGGAAAAALVRGHRRAEGGLLLRLCEVDGAPAQHGRPLLLVEAGGGGPGGREHGGRGAALLGREGEQLVDEGDGLGGERARSRVELEDESTL